MRRAVMGCSQHCSIHSLTALGSSYSVPLLLAAGTVLEQCWNSAGALLPIAVPALSALGTVLLVLARPLIHPSLSLSLSVLHSITATNKLTVSPSLVQLIPALHTYTHTHSNTLLQFSQVPSLAQPLH